MVFIKNNDRIDFIELERRVALELDGMSKAAPRPAPVAPGAAKPEPPPRSARRTLANLLWGATHLPFIMRRAIAAVFLAEDAQARALQLEAEMRRQRNLMDQAAASARADMAGMAATVDGLARALSAFKADISGLAAGVEQLERQAGMIKREVMFQQRRLTQAAAAGPVPPGSPEPPAVAGRHDSLYAAFEDVFRGAREDIKQRLAFYVEHLALAGAGQPDHPVLDIGCGRGEWLDLLREHGMAAYGIDSNLIMVERTTALGLDARHADLLAHLRGLGDASRGAVTAFHVVEHLPFGTLVDFLDETLRVLVPGGILVIESPNAETVRVGATTFYNDPTHRNPVLPEPLRFVIEHRGFASAEIIRLHPFTQGLLTAATEDANLLNRVLFGPQDYAIVARRL